MLVESSSEIVFWTYVYKGRATRRVAIESLLDDTLNGDSSDWTVYGGPDRVIESTHNPSAPRA